MKKAPCKECTERHLGCHSTCDSYQEYVKEREIYREERLKRSEEIHFKKLNINSTKKKGGKR